jgi:agmatine deiminase
MSDDCRTYLPAEWAPQSGVMLIWPHVRSDWAKTLQRVETVYVDLTDKIARFETVLIVCNDAAHQAYIEKLLASIAIDPKRIRFVIAPSNDTWARDNGPLSVICSGEPQLLDFQYNGLGGKYESGLDNAISPTVFRTGVFGDTPMETINLVLEGGAVEVDGSGTLLATRSSVLSASRNGKMTQREIEQQLSHYLGVERFLWLGHGALSGDDTDSHIDTLARFCDRDTIAYCYSDNPEDTDHVELVAMREELAAFRSITGDPYRLVPLPMPAAKVDDDGKRLPATYANFLIINDAVLVPTYDDPADELAMAQLGECFPDRKVIGVNALPLIHQYGSLHCITMQFPEGVII